MLGFDFKKKVRKPRDESLLLDEEFVKRFDSETCIYDVIPVGSNDFVAICPPLKKENVQEFFLDFGIVDYRVKEFPRCTKIFFQDDKKKLPLSILTSKLISFLSNYQPKNILYTLQKDNHLEWILEWSRIHVNSHNCDCIVIYDNNSKNYSPADIEESLKVLGIPVFVLSVPYKYGPSAGSHHKNWGFEYMYLQDCCLEHIRELVSSICLDSAAILNVDVDEIVAATNDFPNIFDAARSSHSFQTRFFGFDTYKKHVENNENIPRHDEHLIISTNWPSSPAKYVFVPYKLGEDVYLGPHRVSCLIDWELDFEFRKPNVSYYFFHCRSINTGWKDSARATTWAPKDDQLELIEPFKLTDKQINVLKKTSLKNRLALEFPNISFEECISFFS